MSSSTKKYDKNVQLREMLDVQRSLLRKSVVAMTEGDLSEALRVATSIRVLVHETASSKPLLKQLSPNYLDLKILAEPPAKPVKPENRIILSIPIGLQITEEGKVLLNSELDLGRHELTILGKWWRRPCLLIPGLEGFSRRGIILGLANKEGGTHVDLNVSRRYQRLLDSRALEIQSGQEVTPVNLSRLMAGQAGLQMLDCLDRHFPP